jgi:hypothetical protein
MSEPTRKQTTIEVLNDEYRILQSSIIGDDKDPETQKLLFAYRRVLIDLDPAWKGKIL